VQPLAPLPDLLLLARCRLQLLLQLLRPPLLLLQPQQQPRQQPPDQHLLLLRQALLLQLLLPPMQQQTLLLPLLDRLPSPQHLQPPAALQVLLLLQRPLYSPLGSQPLSCNRLRSPRSPHQQQQQRHALLPILLDTLPCRLLALPWAGQLPDRLLLLLPP
jgi:hypothetical protein